MKKSVSEDALKEAKKQLKEQGVVIEEVGDSWRWSWRSENYPADVGGEMLHEVDAVLDGFLELVGRLS